MFCSALLARALQFTKDSFRPAGERSASITAKHLADRTCRRTNPLFSGVDKGLSEEWHYSFSHCVFDAPVAGRLKITGQYQSNQPVYGIVAYVDPDGGGDYNAVSYAGMLDLDNTFSFDINSLPRSKKAGEIRVILLCAGGQQLGGQVSETGRLAYTIDADGRLLVNAGKSTVATHK